MMQSAYFYFCQSIRQMLHQNLKNAFVLDSTLQCYKTFLQSASRTQLLAHERICHTQSQTFVMQWRIHTFPKTGCFLTLHWKQCGAGFEVWVVFESDDHGFQIVLTYHINPYWHSRKKWFFLQDLFWKGIFLIFPQEISWFGSAFLISQPRNWCRVCRPHWADYMLGAPPQRERRGLLVCFNKTKDAT